MGGAVILLGWGAVEALVARRFASIGLVDEARTHRRFGLAMVAIGAVLLALTWMAR